MRDQIDSVAHLVEERQFQPLEALAPDAEDARGDRGYLQQLKTQTNDSVLKTNAAGILNGFSIQGSEQLMAQARCVNGWATIYGPTGNRTADGSVYTGREQGAAVDLDAPVLNTRLGSIVVITNLNNDRSTTQQVRDYGGFGNPRVYRTPDGAPRLVDLTYGAAARIGAGDMTPVKVCVPE